ncbi:uncharacterized protein LTR77_008311 [Saxophila tyrrhenica]|uniref:SMODS and SLOG-associating 2TM effector domain-containing protein n=1 Tax=Saxophila tyrrhenica TaxID=1690608 RepID=A0AAV9P3E2_9PEZI|nr:hypothetical protein LTR77_008311 [Saxophila tyrrhenica]
MDDNSPSMGRSVFKIRPKTQAMDAILHAVPSGLSSLCLDNSVFEPTTVPLKTNNDGIILTGRNWISPVMSLSGERTPLLEDAGFNGEGSGEEQLFRLDHHHQFCRLVGIRPRNLPPDQKHNPPPESLYCRAVRQVRIQNMMYQFTATTTNTLMLSQVVLGATLTGLSASDSSHILVAVFGALNTIIAGIIAFLKSRGQPMRARMYRDDLERVVDDIENSAIMWLGISKNVHGYDAIDIDDQVTVRGEVARLTRLYDKAVKTNTLNDPDMYSTGGPGDLHSAALRDRTVQSGPVTIPPPAPMPAPASEPAAVPPPATVPPDPDAAPATKPPEALPKDAEAVAGTQPPTAPSGPSNAPPQNQGGNAVPNGTSAKPEEQPAQVPSNDIPTASSSSTVTAPPSTSIAPDPDESPATAMHPQKHTEDVSADEKT